MKIKIAVISITILFISFACTKPNENPDASKIDQLQKRVAALEQRIEDTKPSLSGIMGGIQRHHGKLYYAGVRENWKLAEYELKEIEEGIEHSANSYPSAKTGPQLMSSSINSLKSAIQKRDAKRFPTDFDQLTQSCNQCHQNQEHGFIEIKPPGPGMFTDQKFRL